MDKFRKINNEKEKSKTKNQADRNKPKSVLINNTPKHKPMIISNRFDSYLNNTYINYINRQVKQDEEKATKKSTSKSTFTVDNNINNLYSRNKKNCLLSNNTNSNISNLSQRIQKNEKLKESSSLLSSKVFNINNTINYNYNYGSISNDSNINPKHVLQERENNSQKTFSKEKEQKSISFLKKMKIKLNSTRNKSDYLNRLVNSNSKNNDNNNENTIKTIKNSSSLKTIKDNKETSSNDNYKINNISSTRNFKSRNNLHFLSNNNTDTPIEKHSYKQYLSFNQSSKNIDDHEDLSTNTVYLTYNNLHSKSKSPISLSYLNHLFNGFEESKCSIKSNPPIYSYAVNTYQGIIRNYNEDRVSIVLNISKPENYHGKTWPKCSFFGIYDGHGGSLCADYLRDNLHLFIINDSSFPDNPYTAIKNGFSKAENEFLYKISYDKDKNIIYDKSGSCALILFIIEHKAYIGNLGDSRAVLSRNKGQTYDVITYDHKPNTDIENERITRLGGKIYQTQTHTKTYNKSSNNYITNIIMGPHRVFPGRLSVSRTIGDIEAKEKLLGGIYNVISGIPDIYEVDIDSTCDFIFLGCDGVYDQLSNKEIIEGIWKIPINDQITVHKRSSLAVDLIMKSSMINKSYDNITCLIIGLKGFSNLSNEKEDKDYRPRIINNKKSKIIPSSHLEKFIRK